LDCFQSKLFYTSAADGTTTQLVKGQSEIVRTQFALGAFLTATVLLVNYCDPALPATGVIVQNQYVYTTNGNNILKFALPAATSENVAPTQDITGVATNLSDPHRTA